VGVTVALVVTFLKIAVESRFDRRSSRTSASVTHCRFSSALYFVSLPPKYWVFRFFSCASTCLSVTDTPRLGAF
jgi:hypothetical protein